MFCQIIVIPCFALGSICSQGMQILLFPYHPHTKMAYLSLHSQNMVGTGYYLKYGCSFYVPFYGFVIFFVIFGCKILIVFKNNQFEYNVKVNSSIHFYKEYTSKIWNFTEFEKSGQTLTFCAHLSPDYQMTSLPISQMD